MAVDSTHKEYDALLPLWQTMRATSAGERAVKAAGTEYLPMLGGQSKDRDGQAQYEAFKQRASFYNATGRTIDGLSGMIFRKIPQVEVPASMEEWLDDVTLGGLDFQGFAECVVEDVLTVGRAGILVDFPRVEVGGLTQAEADRMNLRPFLSMYRAESILNWRTGMIGNRTMLTQVRLLEQYSEPVDEFEDDEGEQIRVLDLAGEGDELYYRQRIFRKEGRKKEWAQVGDDIVPTMGGRTLDYIPFVFTNPRDTAPNVDKPPLIDLADKNLDHYRMDADYHHSLHFLAAASTRWVKGVTQEEIDEGCFDEVGPTAYHASTSADAEFGISEPSGHGIPAQRQALQDAEQQMAFLGARMLSPDKRAAEAVETAAIHRQGEMSVLASLALAVSSALCKALEIARDWSGSTEAVTVRLNTDYMPNVMDPGLLTALTQALQAGGISQMAYIEALIQGEVIRDDITPEYEAERVAQDGFSPAETL